MKVKHEFPYIVYIIESIEAVENYTDGNARLILRDEKTFQACLYRLQTLADACGKLEEATQKSHTEIPWARIRGFRNVLAHDYTMKIDAMRVVEIIEEELPKLKAALYPIYQEKLHEYR